MQRCDWCGSAPDYVAYHDTEWGIPQRDGRELWEKLMLDGFQAGLSWITILRKRDAFREVFEGFDPERVARWDEPQVAAALQDARIVRSRAKISSTILGARAMLRIEEREGFSDWLWSRVDGTPIQNSWHDMGEVPTQTPLSEQLSRDLKAEGFKFCGPVITYAFMQAAGLVNDHLVPCFRHEEVRAMARPTG